MLCCMKAKLLLVLVVELSARAGVAAEQPAVTEPKWLTDASGCKFLSPSPRANATIEWDGKCVESFVGGPGEVRVGRVVYRGEFSRGRIVKGSIETGNGEVAEGEFLDNRLHGDAVIRAPGWRHHQRAIRPRYASRRARRARLAGWNAIRRRGRPAVQVFARQRGSEIPRRLGVRGRIPAGSTDGRWCQEICRRRDPPRHVRQRPARGQGLDRIFRPGTL